MIPTRLPLAAASVAVVLGLASLTACSSDDPSDGPTTSDDAAPAQTGESDTATTTPSPSPTPTEPEPYLPVDDAVELTPEGAELGFGEAATVAYEPRQDQVAVLKVKILRVDETSVKESLSEWDLDPVEKKSQPYFVRARVTNAGDVDLGGRDLPLYLVDGEARVLESTRFSEDFEACPSTGLPEKFAPGTSARVCLVFLAPDRSSFESVEFFPTDRIEPITWSGETLGIDDPDPNRAGTKEKSEKDEDRRGERGDGRQREDAPTGAPS